MALAAASSHSPRPDWIRLCPSAPHHRYVHLVARRGDCAIYGYALARLTPLLAGFTLASVRRGPIAALLDLLAPALSAFMQILRPMGVCSLFVNPRYQGAEDTGKVIAALLALGGAVLPDAQESQNQATLLFDLSGSEADPRAPQATLPPPDH